MGNYEIRENVVGIENVETWSDCQYGDCASVSESTAVTAGKSYRTVATVTVWNGSSSESRTLTSETIKA